MMSDQNPSSPPPLAEEELKEEVYPFSKVQLDKVYHFDALESGWKFVFVNESSAANSLQSQAVQAYLKGA
jgi:hypothetical protein